MKKLLLSLFLFFASFLFLGSSFSMNWKDDFGKPLLKEGTNQFQ
jgi:hypothetical protein